MLQVAVFSLLFTGFHIVSVFVCVFMCNIVLLPLYLLFFYNCIFHFYLNEFHRPMYLFRFLGSFYYCVVFVGLLFAYLCISSDFTIYF